MRKNKRKPIIGLILSVICGTIAMFFPCGLFAFYQEYDSSIQMVPLITNSDSEFVINGPDTEKQSPVFSMFMNAETEKRYYLAGIKDKGLGYHIVESLTAKLIENQVWITRLNDDEDMFGSPDSTQSERVEIYHGETRDVYYIKRDIATRLVSSAVADAFEKTRIGRKIRNLERTVSNFFRIQYEKPLHREGVFLLPGQAGQALVENADADGPKEYSISFSTLFFADAKSLHGNVSFEVEAQYLNNFFSAKYDYDKEQVQTRLWNSGLDKILGIDTRLMFVNNPSEAAGMLVVSRKF